MPANPVPIGTIVSEGTLRTTDLIDAFLAFARDHAPERARKLVVLYEVDEDDLATWVDEHPDDAEWLLQDLIDELAKLAPPGAWFGAHPGDGACYGYWPDIDSE